MLIFGDPMGYLLTSSMVFDDNQRLTSNHYHALEMTFGGSKSFLDLVINSLKTQNNHIWRPHGVFIDLRHGFRWLSKIEVKSLPCTRNVFWGSKSFPYLVINCLKPKMIIFGDPKGYSLTFGMVFHDDQRLSSNHYHALEMSCGGQNHS